MQQVSRLLGVLVLLSGWVSGCGEVTGHSARTYEDDGDYSDTVGITLRPGQKPPPQTPPYFDPNIPAPDPPDAPPPRADPAP